MLASLIVFFAYATAAAARKLGALQALPLNLSASFWACHHLNMIKFTCLYWKFYIWNSFT
jgi:hypothetical protein